MAGFDRSYRAYVVAEADHNRPPKSLRSRVGEVLNHADMVEGRIAAQSLVAQTERSNAEDLDMIEGTSEFQSWQSGYEAALKAYASVQRMSLLQHLKL